MFRSEACQNIKGHNDSLAPLSVKTALHINHNLSGLYAWLTFLFSRNPFIFHACLDDKLGFVLRRCCTANRCVSKHRWRKQIWEGRRETTARMRANSKELPNAPEMHQLTHYNSQSSRKMLHICQERRKETGHRHSVFLTSPSCNFSISLKPWSFLNCIKNSTISVKLAVLFWVAENVQPQKKNGTLYILVWCLIKNKTQLKDSS